MTSDEPHPGRCGAKCRDGGYCEAYPVSGRDRCRMHGGTSPVGAESPNYQHGAYSDYLRSDLTEAEEAAFDELVDALEEPQDALDAIKQIAAEALLKYKRSGDSRFLREFRQLADSFNFAPNEDLQSIDADVTTDLEQAVADFVTYESDESDDT